MQIEYKKNFTQVLQRYQALWAGQLRDQILVRIQVRQGQVQRDAFMLNVPDIPRMFEDYIEYWRTTLLLEDDTLPVVAPNFGVGICGGIFGSEVIYESATSWCKHIPNLIEHPEKIAYDPDGGSANLLKKCLQYYCKNDTGKTIVAPPGIDGPVDLLYLLRGSESYMDVVDHPEKFKTLLRKVAEGIKQFRKEIWDVFPLYEGGTFNSWMNWWVPQRTGLLSGDLFCSCSAQVYKDFGLPLDQEMADHFGTAWYHLHNLGLHLIPEIIKIRGLICLELSEDPNVHLQGLDLLKKVRSQVPDELVVIVAVRPQEFVDALEKRELPGNTIYNVCEESYGDIENWSVDYANTLMEKAREYRSSGT